MLGYYFDNQIIIGEDNMNNKKRVIKNVMIVFLVLIIVSISIFIAMFHKEVATLGTVKKVDDNTLYTMEYKGDYGFDAFLEKGASSDKELVSFVTERLLKGIPLKFSIPDLGCSTFRAMSVEGDQLFGRNFDLTYSPAMLVKTKPDNGYASISMVNLAFLGYTKDKLPDSFQDRLISLAAPYAPLDGMNEKGVSIGVLLIPSDPTDQKTDKVDITTTTAVRLVLDKAANVDEAVALLKNYDMHSSANSSYHFQISDALGKSVVVEYIDNELKVVEQEGNYQAATNFLLTPGDYSYGYGYERYDTLVSTLSDKNGVLSEDEAMNLLKDAAQQWHVNDKNEMSATQWSVVYNNTKKTVKIVVGLQYDKVHEFSLFDE